MFKKHILPFLGMALPLASSAAEMHQNLIIEYPDFPELSISVPNNYKIYNKERYGVFSDDGKLEIAGTAYRSKGKDMPTKEFAEARIDSIPKDMPWYDAVTQLKSIEGLKYEAYGIEYTGTWPNEDEPTSYLVIAFKANDILLSLTFTALTADIDSRRPTIRNIIESVYFHQY